MSTPRIQQALDGELGLDRLDAAELAEYERFRDACDAAVSPMGAIAEIDVTPGVMHRIRQNAPARRPAPRRPMRAAARWLWTPRRLDLRVRPGFALAAAASLAALVAVRAPLAQHPVPRARMVVEFRLGAPGAHRVALVGDFTAWKPGHELRETAPGVWAVSVSLEPGVYNYGFMVDGTAIRLDPLAPHVADGFGGENSRISVLPPDLRS